MCNHHPSSRIHNSIHPCMQPAIDDGHSSGTTTGVRGARAGASGDALNYAAGAKSSTSRSQLVSATNAENIGYDVGRR